MRGEGDGRAISNQSIAGQLSLEEQSAVECSITHDWVYSNPELAEKTKSLCDCQLSHSRSLLRRESYLRSASTTMKTTRSKGAAGGGPYSESL